MEKYQFGEYILCSDLTLSRNGYALSIPPKEIAVLFLLVRNAGAVISKENIISTVWKGGMVSDESLTRCVYAIRKILGESPDCRYVETVYGKGYRFAMDTQHVHESALQLNENRKEVIAIFPFIMKRKEQSLIIFDYIINHGDLFDKKGYRLMPAAMTIKSNDFMSSFSQLRKAGARYFLTGIEVATDNRSIIRLELTESESYTVVFRDTVIITTDMAINLVNISRCISQMIGLTEQSAPHNFIKNFVAAQNTVDKYASGNHSEHFFSDFCDPSTPVLQDLAAFDTPRLCSLSGCYFALASLGIMAFTEAAEIISLITAKILETCPGNASALSMNTLIHTLNQMEDSESDFRMAMILSPLSPEVYYHYACYMMLKSDYSRASRMTGIALSLDPNLFSAKILNIAILTLRDQLDAAIEYASSLLGQDHLCDIVLWSLLAILHTQQDKMEEANNYLEKIRTYRQRCSFVNACYETAISYSGNERQFPVEKLRSVSQKRFPQDAVYWLPLFEQNDQGKAFGSHGK